MCCTDGQLAWGQPLHYRPIYPRAREVWALGYTPRFLMLHSLEAAAKDLAITYPLIHCGRHTQIFTRRNIDQYLSCQVDPYLPPENRSQVVGIPGLRM